MGIFKHLQDEIDGREDREEGISLAELLELSPSLRRLMNRITRHGELTVAQAADEVDMDPDEVQDMLTRLVGKGYLVREERDEGWVYQIRFARKRGASLPPGIWSALGRRAEAEGDEE
jgi:DNA-binding MarR family transcriptional regulator